MTFIPVQIEKQHIELRKSYLVTPENGESFIIGLVTDGPDDTSSVPWKFISGAFVPRRDWPNNRYAFVTNFWDVITSHPECPKELVIKDVEEVFTEPEKWNIQHWAQEDQAAAMAMGWGVFWVDKQRPEIQRVDALDAFDTDHDAARYVWRLAQGGHPLCMKAIAAIQACYP